MSSKETITLCIPTKNRADFLRRLLHYFADTEYQGWLVIGDSSNDAQIDETKKTVQFLKDRLKIRHLECSGLSITEAIEFMKQYITTPYCALLTDDDFLCVNGINRCVDFLDKNHDYGVAHGIAISTSVDRPGPYGNISEVRHYPHPALDGQSGSQRLCTFFRDGPFTLEHDVHRSSDWIEMHYGFMSKPWARSAFIFDALTFSVVSATRNRVKEIDCLYMVRFGHDRIYSQVHVYDWFTSQDWHPGFKDLHDRAIAELIRQDGISKEEAEADFKQAISPYLGRLFSRLLPSVQQSYKPGALPRLMKIGRHVPGLKAAYDTIMPRFRAPDEANLLPALLKPGSPYHEDFMPIYRSITTSPPK